MKNWKIAHELGNKKSELNLEKLIDVLLENRGITTKKEREDFLHPRLEDVTPKNVGLDSKQLKKALQRIAQAIEKQEQIVVFGDYDVDGITGSAILWETLHALGAKVIPYIPHRVDEGYGLSKIGVSNILEKFSQVDLIITVDNGIVASEAVDFANEQGIDVIITDHHLPPAGGEENLPKAFAIVHTTKLCGAGVAWVLSKEIRNVIARNEVTRQSHEGARDDDTHLELAALGTVADLVPLVGPNRAIVTHGLKKLSQTKRLGLRALFKQAGLEKEILDVYDIGYMIAPRLNASGRIESAMDSLRLLCTTNRDRATMLAEQIELINRQRQQFMRKATDHAVGGVKEQGLGARRILIIAHESYQEGVIGLVAGKLVEVYYRPTIVISKGEKHSKGSVRSISGFNIIEFLRLQPELFLSLGGHPMAAGFSIETEKIILFTETFEKLAEVMVTEEHLVRSLRIDCELPLAEVSKELYNGIQQLAPFGMGNPEPVFVSRGVKVENLRVIGKEKNHLKLVVSKFDSIGFGMGELGESLSIGDKIDLAYTIDENTWNGNTKLQLKVKDIKQA